MKPYLSIIIPSYNEYKRLPMTLTDINKRLADFDFSYEILVVDDGSKDATEDVVRRFSHLMENLRLVDNKENHGKGWVVRQGMLEAKGEIRLFMDADNSTSIDQFKNMIPYFKQGYDAVIGSRDVKGAKLVPPQPWYKRLAGNIGNLVIQILLLPGMWDSQCGFKAFTEEAAKKIFPLMRINRWAFDVESLVLAKKLGYKIKEIPVTWVNDPESKVKLSGYVNFFSEVLKIKWWTMTGRYNVKLKNQNGK